MSVIRPSALDPFFLGLDTYFQQGYQSYMNTYEKWTQTVTSSSRSTLHGWMDKFPKLREWLGPRQVENIIAHSYELVNKKFELTFGVNRTDIEDDQYGLYGPSAQMLGMQAAQWPDDQMTPVLEGAGSETTFDGAAFYSSTHPIDPANAAAGTQSNVMTSSPLSPENIAAMDAQFMGLKGRDGKSFGMQLTDVMVPPALKHKALQIANAEYIVNADGINAAAGGASNVLKGTFNVIVNPKLTSSTTWYGFDNRWPMKAFIWQLRKAPEFTYIVDPTNPTVFSNDQYEYGVRARGVGGLGLWFMSIKATA